MAAAAAIVLSAWPVTASEVIDETELSGTTTIKGCIEVPDITDTPDTDGAEVKADESLPEDISTEEENIETVDDGGVTYIISIPSTVDFGTLNPSDSGSGIVQQSVNVVAATINGLTEGQGVAVYVQDGATGSADFRLYGAEAANSGKSLPYNVLMGGQPVAQNGNPDGNGYWFTTFHAAGEAAVLSLQFDQTQLPAKTLRNGQEIIRAPSVSTVSCSVQVSHNREV